MDEVIELFDGFNQFKTIYDIGAHKGVFTKSAVSMFPNATFYMFEANKPRPNGIDEKHVWFQTVLSDQDDKMVQFYGNNSTGDSYYKETTGVYDTIIPKWLTTKTLETMMRENDMPLPDYIKIDTQGSELDILSASGAALDHCKVLLCEIPAKSVIYNSNAPSHEEYMNFFRMMGFQNHKIIRDIMSKDKLIQHDVVYYK